ncbi:MAG TPA: thioredoxin family protein [Gemmatimonadales bacterium]|jgi:small redox-active disulfide protein 2|nr:thioredoxin family protein [Gemmatimonadales bacterium]
MKLEILGSGCARCQQLTENTKAAVGALGLDAEIVKVEDVATIAGRGVMATPALAVDGRVRISGRVATPAEIERLLRH